MKDDGKKILLSGVKPTGRPHIGNYFGAMKQFADLQDKYKSYILVADMHALTSVQNGQEMRKNIVDVALDYLAIGIDPGKTVIFKQSDIKEHTELAWIFNCITTMPYLMRAHAFKDAEARNKEISVGLFDYPMLMAADILLYNADLVPVGKDQKQHIEFTRDTAEKFNRIFGETFKLPEAFILESAGIVPGTDGQKMSKSYGNIIELFAEYEDIKKAVMSIPTDSKTVEEAKDPEKDKVFALHKLFSQGEELENIKQKYKNGGFGYKESKQMLVENMEKFISPLREKRRKFSSNKKHVFDILKSGRDAASKFAAAKMEKVREKIGTNIYDF